MNCTNQHEQHQQQKPCLVHRDQAELWKYTVLSHEGTAGQYRTVSRHEGNPRPLSCMLITSSSRLSGDKDHQVWEGDC